MANEKAAYVTGGASGIGREVVEMLVRRGHKVCIADINYEGAKSFADNLKSKGNEALAVELNASDWNSQAQAFEQALKAFGRVDYVFPIAGIAERQAIIPNNPKATKFVKPDLAIVEVDLTGVLYTFSLAIQQMRRQEKDETGHRGKIAAAASVCGFYCIPTMPFYTAAKHGVVGFVRSFGKYLPEEGITLNAVCPSVVKTNISTTEFYDMMESKGLVVPTKDVVAAFESFLDSDISGECLEVGPNGGYSKKPPAEHLDKETTLTLDIMYERGRQMHQPQLS